MEAGLSSCLDRDLGVFCCERYIISYRPITPFRILPSTNYESLSTKTKNMYEYSLPGKPLLTLEGFF